MCRSLARAALTFAGLPAVRVGLIERMAVDAMCLRCPYPGESFAAEHVLAMRYGLQVRRIDAVAHAAEVIDL